MSIIRLLANLKSLGVSIQLQDDKLKIHAPKGKLTAGLLNELKEKKEEVIGFLRRADAAGSYVSIDPVEEKEYYALSSQQKRLYFIQQMSPESAAYNISMEMRLRPDFGKDKERIESILRQLISRHESLRTSFEMVDGQPVQRIHDEVEFAIEYYDQELPSFSTFIRPFDLSKAPLLRSCIIKENGNHYTWVRDMHHIIADGTSQNILEKEIVALYRGEALPELNVQYKDYSEWQRKEEQQRLTKKQERYWLNEFSREIPVLNLPADFLRPMVQSFAGRQLSFFINKEITGMLKELCQEKDITLYMVLLCVFTILLSKLSGQEDIIIGTPIVGRRHADLQDIFGMFVNTLVMRNYPEGDKGFLEFLEEVKVRTLAAYENQEYQFEDLVDRVSVRRDTSRNPLFDVTFNLMTQADFRGDIIQVDAEAIRDGGECNANFDIMFQGVEMNGMIYFTVNYCTKLFRKKTIKRYINYFKKILLEIKKNASGKLSSIEIISGEEKKQLLVDLNDTASGYPRDKTIHELFAEQAEKTPDGVAVVGHGCMDAWMHGNISITFRELNKKSNQLAHLLKEKGIGPDTIVGIMVERSIEMIMGIIGILKAGGAYMPIDPDYPRERIDYMLKDSGARVLLKCNNNGLDKSEIRISKSETNPNDRNSNDQNRIAPCIVLNFEHLNFEFVSNFEIRASNFSPSNMAYIIYTSGTTGRPKGCMIEHRSVVRLLVNDRFQFDFGPADVWTMFHSYCFDFSVWEMWGALVYGGRLIIVPQMTARDPRQFLELLKKQQVTVLNQTPGAFYHLSDEALTDAGHLSNLRYVIFGGEALAPARLKEWKVRFPQTRLINMYGITETTVHVTFKEITHREVRLNECNIGRPIPTLSIYIMDKYLRLQPLGAAGELCVGGEGVARGYLNRPELTGERFFSISYKSYRSYRTYNSKKIYKTGDLARWLPDGELEYLGRIDLQVKIRGYRVELGEIEYHLKMHPEIKEVVVVNVNINRNNRGQNYLCAYFVVRQSSAEEGIENEVEKKLSVSDLKKYLAEKLPDYMIPAYFVEMDKIPLTANGKVDGKMLSQSWETHIHLDSAYVAPETGMQRIIAETWKEVLNRDKVGIRDNFFDLGGNSLDSIVVINKLQEKLKREIPVVTLFTYPTISSLEGYLQRGEGKGDEVPGENASESERFQLIDEGKNLMQQTLIKLDEGD
ncbi:MAG: amino acid adenylation domain-containing protein [Candidatus Aminicenantes bacterium]|nr:amino acid adenylation domain-containing protein [Candidatus Aminicenantes bacterium]NIM78783.1 amino acid adenylation domain-containing protein [Candidatus Aminicenantes bacterium]NIN18038.1 amino acid adenylation domain-containing protein [Candidatus Aminicenantes bacterium]NIN41938.1 amino acid adenylation domain-containing protein [Candidatus Aminicenantes bacterium]NIN84693.1 amino acid adenylation domain-containing protein [Candidatus Aminicenantes bacterium]